MSGQYRNSDQPLDSNVEASALPPAGDAASKAGASATPDHPFLRACRRLPTERTPVWFMRQAGRYLPEYRAIRRNASLLEICHTPELAATVTLLPVDELDVDAAIVFADILLPFEPMGLGLSFIEGTGPRIEHPIQSAADVETLRPVDPVTDLGYVLETIQLASAQLRDRVPLIGFAGAPFTLASYAIEGGATRSFARTKRFMYNEPAAWHELLDNLAQTVGRFLSAQAAAGAGALQLFDSWVGCLSRDDYARYVAPHSARAIELASEAGAPIIHFGTGTSTLLDSMAEAGGDVIGVDWRIPLDEAWEQAPHLGIQGNLDPAVLSAPLPEIQHQVSDVMKRAGRRAGHIFNLGHGVPPTADPERLKAVVSMVRERSVAHV